MRISWRFYLAKNQCNGNQWYRGVNGQSLQHEILMDFGENVMAQDIRNKHNCRWKTTAEIYMWTIWLIMGFTREQGNVEIAERFSNVDCLLISNYCVNNGIGWLHPWQQQWWYHDNNNDDINSSSTEIKCISCLYVGQNKDIIIMLWSYRDKSYIMFILFSNQMIYNHHAKSLLIPD